MDYPDFKSLSEEDLKRIVCENNDSFAVEKLGLDDPGHLDGYRDELQKEYFIRKMDESGDAPSEVVAELISSSVGITTQGLLGELAFFNRLRHSDLQRVLASLPENNWSWRQSQARMLVMEFDEKDEFDRHDIVEQLIKLKAAWAVLELVDLMAAEELRGLISVMMPHNKQVFSRGHRHDIRTRATARLKAD